MADLISSVNLVNLHKPVAQMMPTSEVSFLNGAEKAVFRAYTFSRKHSTLVSEILGRLAAAILLTPAAALDLAFHSIMVIPTCLYSVGKFLYKREADFTLPWQHIQRMRNAVAPLLFGSFFGILHPYAGVAMSEPTDKHAILGMLSSNTKQNFDTPCSPIHSLSIIEDIANHHRFAEINGVKREIFSAEHIQAIKDARNLEESLEIVQAQELIHKISNITGFVMAKIRLSIENSHLSHLSKAILVRASGLLVPILTATDMTVALLAQAFFLATGFARLISGRGPFYTEVTTNPLMHVSFLIQNILKSVGKLIGMCVGFVSPDAGLKATLIPASLFFKLQFNTLLLQIKLKMHFAKENSRFVVPIVKSHKNCSDLSVPFRSMHTTYLIVEKKKGRFNSYYVERPFVSSREMNAKDTIDQIRSKLNGRFPSMDIEKKESAIFWFYSRLEDQGNKRNCVVSNMFAAFEVIDSLRKEQKEVAELRYRVVREALMKDYGFYKSSFFPFTEEADGYSLDSIWRNSENYPTAAI